MTRRIGDVVVVGAGVVLLVAGFLPWWRSEVIAGGVALGPVHGHTAWDASPAWWLPVLAGTVTGGLWGLRRTLTVRWLPAVTALTGVIGLGLVVGRWLTLAPGSGDFGWYAYSPLTDTDGVPAIGGTPGIGLWLALAALAAQAAAAGLNLRRRDRPTADPGARSPG